MAADSAEPIDFLMAGIGDSNGNRLSGGKVYMYDAGTDKDRTTWDDSGKVTPSANPVILDSRGTALVFADGNYKMIVKTAEGVTLYTHDFLHYGHLGQGGFFIADDPRDGGLQGAGELVTDPDGLGGGGDGGGGAQITDNGEVNGVAGPCGGLIPCHCKCCHPTAYRITITGGTGGNSGFNGSWQLPSVSPGLGIYRRDISAGLVSLDVSGDGCEDATVIIGNAAGQTTLSTGFPNDESGCSGNGTAGEFSWTVCPIGPFSDLNPIEITLSGLHSPCTGCIKDTQTGESWSISGINVQNLDGTYSLGPTGSCTWVYTDSGVQRFLFSGPYRSVPKCTNLISANGELHNLNIQVKINGTTDEIEVVVIGVGGNTGRHGSIRAFTASLALPIGKDGCQDTLVFANELECIDQPGNPVVSDGGSVSIEFNP